MILSFFLTNMQNLNETQKKILKVFYDLQCFDDSGNFNDDETPCVRYYLLEKELNIQRNKLRIDMIRLRNERIIELVPTVDYDYQPSGSGWILTEKKGAELVKELFYKPVTSLGNEV